MKVLTLHQPWASLVALGVKTIETRSWSTRYRGPLAIHAAARVPVPHRGPMFVGDFHVAQGGTWLHGPDHDARMPLGAIVATAQLLDVVPITRRNSGEPDPGDGAYIVPYADGVLGLVPAKASTCSRCFVAGDQPVHAEFAKMGNDDADEVARELCLYGGGHVADFSITDQRPYGDFAPGRYAWLLADIEPLAEPVPFKGGQGLTREWTP